MNKTLSAGALLALSLTAWSGPAAAADVGVSIAISQPGVYGRIDIGSYPQPVLVQPQAVLVRRPPHAAPPPPVYLWVPPGHQKNWRKHCYRYNACGVPVYFVQDQWYREHVAPPRPPGPPPRHEPQGRGHDRDHNRGHDDGPGRGGPPR